jgi:riboflavin biosynthesis pyrimidine reductase
MCRGFPRFRGRSFDCDVGVGYSEDHFRRSARAVKKTRRVIVHIATSADGYIARPDGDIEWLTERPAAARVIASFLDDGAIDEFIISVVPVFIGQGIPLIAPRHRHVPLQLRSTESFADGVVQLHYDG